MELYYWDDAIGNQKKINKIVARFRYVLSVRTLCDSSHPIYRDVSHFDLDDATLQLITLGYPTEKLTSLYDL